MRFKLLLFISLFFSVFASASVKINEVSGWFESGFVTWDLVDEADSYAVYYRAANGQYSKLDAELVRNYGSYGRADIVGISAGSYQFKVVPVDGEGNEISSLSSESEVFTAKTHDRAGYAHFNYQHVGAYNDNGTLKNDARVVYVTGKTAKTVTCVVNGTTHTGLQSIIKSYEKGTDIKPLAIRIIGTIEAADMDYFESSAEGIQVKGKNGYAEMNMTIEGIGNDAGIRGFGFLIRNCRSLEIRNLAIYLCLDDCLSFDTNNSNCWVHHIDFFYGKTGSAADQAKGDGSLDCKADSKDMTFSYNRFWDSGKMALCGMKAESTESHISYHHNWFDHSDSRHPRVRTITVHVYNNYFDGCSKYGVGATMGSSIFVESNYYRNTSKPMMSSKQGTDANGDGTFSGENGGVIKSFGNVFAQKSGNFSYITHKQSPKSFDAYEAESRDEIVADTYVALQGGTKYNNFDTNPSRMYKYTADAATDVPAIVTGDFGAGRMQHGDFEWTFNNAVDDTDYGVNAGLKKAITDYKSSLVGIFGQENTGNGGDGGNEGEGEGEGEGGNPSLPSDGNFVCTFAKEGQSNSFYKIAGSVSNSKGVATIGGVEHNYCLKLESATTIEFTITEPMTLTLIFGDTETSPTIKINNVDHVGSGTSITKALDAGSYTLSKKNTQNLFFINLEGSTTSLEIPTFDTDDLDGPVYDMLGRPVTTPDKGIYIKNGKKIIIR